MAKLVIVLALALFAVAYVDGLKCYECTNCTEVKDDQIKNCTGTGITGCYISGNPKDESWNRGCAISKEDKCKQAESDDFKCSFCTDDECNSGSYLTASVVLSVSVAAIIRMLH